MLPIVGLPQPIKPVAPDNVGGQVSDGGNRPFLPALALSILGGLVANHLTRARPVIQLNLVSPA